MTQRIVLTTDAEAELNEAVRWYETAALGTGDRLLIAITRAYNSIQNGPESFSLINKDLRQLLWADFLIESFSISPQKRSLSWRSDIPAASHPISMAFDESTGL